MFSCGVENIEIKRSLASQKMIQDSKFVKHNYFCFLAVINLYTIERSNPKTASTMATINALE